MNITSILTGLKSERTALDKAIAAIESINSNGRRRGRPGGITVAPKRRKRQMSAAARRRLSLLLKKRWAQGKMKRKKKVG